jgi:hypothetical protein
MSAKEYAGTYSTRGSMRTRPGNEISQNPSDFRLGTLRFILDISYSFFSRRALCASMHQELQFEIA